MARANSSVTRIDLQEPIDVTVGEVEIKNDTGNPVPTKDDYQTGQVLADQSGAGAVLTFTFSDAMSMVVCLSTGTSLTARADPFGGTPTASLGIRLDDGVPVFIPVATSSVKVHAPVGTTISCWGLRRT